MDRQSRRQFLQGCLLLTGGSLITGCRLSPGRDRQSTRVPHLGVLRPESPSDPRARTQIEAFRAGLRDLGYVDGNNIVLDLRWANDRPAYLFDLAEELAAVPIDIFVVVGRLGSGAALAASPTIPVVMAYHSDPLGDRIVESLDHPAERVTGLTSVGPGNAARRLDLLHEIVPQAARIALLWDSANPLARAELKATQVAAQRMGMTLHAAAVGTSFDLEQAIRPASMLAEAILVIAPGIPSLLRLSVVEVIREHRLPAIFSESECARLGGLMAFGANLTDLHRRAATYVHQILLGAAPGDLPIGLPIECELVVNVTAARELGLTMPSSILVEADEIIR